MKDRTYLVLVIIGIIISLFVVINYKIGAGIIYLVIAGAALLISTNFVGIKKLGGK